MAFKTEIYDDDDRAVSSAINEKLKEHIQDDGIGWDKKTNARRFQICGKRSNSCIEILTQEKAVS